MRTITVVTATRAEYGLLRPVVQKIAASDVLDLQLVVTGAHLCPRLGETVHEIEADGLPIAARLPIFTDNADEPVAKTIARTMEIFDNYFAAQSTPNFTPIPFPKLYKLYTLYTKPASSLQNLYRDCTVLWSKPAQNRGTISLLPVKH